MLDQLTVFPFVLGPLSGHRDESSASWLMVMLDEASFVGVFPYRQARARRPPGLDYLVVRPRVRTDPFKQVEDQSVYGVRHGSLLSVGPDDSIYLAWATSCDLTPKLPASPPAVSFGVSEN